MPSGIYKRGFIKRKTKPIEQRFWEKVKYSNNLFECWEWIAYKDSYGYGMFRFNFQKHWNLF